MNTKTLRKGTVIRMTADMPYMMPDPEPWEVVSAPDPEWWTAKVIKADILHPWDDILDEHGVYLLNQGEGIWCDTTSEYQPAALSNVEVIVP